MKGLKRVFTILLILSPGIAAFAYQYWLYRTPAGVVAVVPAGVEAFVESSVHRALDIDAMPSLTTVKNESVAAADAYLKDTGRGIDATAGNEARFYPFQILTWHEAVNDVLGNMPVLVTYTPLTGTSAVFERRLPDGTLLVFAGTDLVWNNARLLQDTNTGSIWIPGIGLAVRGPLKGTQLTQIASVAVRTWSSIKNEGFGGSVLSRVSTGFERDYTRDPHEGYAGTPDVIFPVDALDPRLPPKTSILGMRAGENTRAWSESDVHTQIVLSDLVGDEPVVLLYDTDTETVHAFSRTVNGRTLTFVLDDDLGIIDTETKSLWRTTGKAYGGTMKNASLTPLPITPSYWFFWYVAFPQTSLYAAS